MVMTGEWLMALFCPDYFFYIDGSDCLGSRTHLFSTGFLYICLSSKSRNDGTHMCIPLKKWPILQ